MYFAYAIKSISRNYIYVGMSNDLEKRLKQHNKGQNKTTKAYRPFVLILSEEFETREAARKREKYLKSGIGKEYLKALLK
jgi:putative endonuclease